MRRAALLGGCSLLLLLGACVSGEASFQCTVEFPVFPTISGAPVTCQGKAAGLIAGNFDMGGTFTLSAASVPFTANIRSWETYGCLPLTSVPIAGYATGDFEITGLTGSGGGARAVGSFEWIKFGVAASWLNIFSTRIFFNDGRTATQDPEFGRAQGFATFRPVSPATGRTCSAPGPLTAHITGDIIASL